MQMQYQFALQIRKEGGRDCAWEWLNKRWSKKIGEGPKSKRFTSARYVSHFHAPRNCRSQLIRYPEECFIKAFINPVLFLLTRLTFATRTVLNPEKVCASRRNAAVAEKLREPV